MRGEGGADIKIFASNATRPDMQQVEEGLQPGQTCAVQPQSGLGPPDYEELSQLRSGNFVDQSVKSWTCFTIKYLETLTLRESSHYCSYAVITFELSWN